MPNFWQPHYASPYYGLTPADAPSAAMLLTNVLASVLKYKLNTYGPFIMQIDDPTYTNFNADGTINFRSDLYPDGIAAVASTLHSNNVGLGIYLRGVDANNGAHNQPGLTNYNNYETVGTNLAALGVDSIDYDDDITANTPFNDFNSAYGYELRLFSAFKSYVSRPSSFPLILRSEFSVSNVPPEIKSIPRPLVYEAFGEYNYFPANGVGAGTNQAAYYWVGYLSVFDRTMNLPIQPNINGLWNAITHVWLNDNNTGIPKFQIALPRCWECQCSLPGFLVPTRRTIARTILTSLKYFRFNRTLPGPDRLFFVPMGGKQILNGWLENWWITASQFF